MDAARLFTPISAMGVFYIIYGSMRVITQIGGQYAIKVSYSKDKVLKTLFRNYSLLRESTTMVLLRKTSTKLLISKFFHQDNALVFKIFHLKILMVFGVSLA